MTSLQSVQRANPKSPRSADAGGGDFIYHEHSSKERRKNEQQETLWNARKVVQDFYNCWLLMVILPIGWGLKAALVVFNPQGRTAVSAIAGEQNWRKVAFARLPIALLLGILTWFA